jgi:hypothetical protein
MRSNRNGNPLTSIPADVSKRRSGRFRCEDLRVVIGQERGFVLDLSASGMRVSLSRDPGLRQGAQVRTVLQSAVGENALEASVVWCAKRGFRRFEAGVTFLGITPQIRAELAALARMATDTNTVYKR